MLCLPDIPVHGRLTASAPLAEEVGGPKRLFALSSAAGAALSAPLAAALYWGAPDPERAAFLPASSWWRFVLIAGFGLVLDFYAEAVSRGAFARRDGAALSVAVSFGCAGAIELLRSGEGVGTLTWVCAGILAWLTCRSALTLTCSL